MIHAIDTAALTELHTQGAQLLLPHAHAARLWRGRLTGTSSDMETRPPLAWTEWTASLWSQALLQGQDDRVLLSALQEEELWTRIIEGAHRLPSSAVHDLAALAASGLRRAGAFRCLGRLANEADTPDARTFSEWQQLLLARCEEERLLPAAYLEESLASLVFGGKLLLGARTCLIGFEEMTPAQQMLLEAFERSGQPVSAFALQHESHSAAGPWAVQLADETEQLRFAVNLIGQHARQQPESSFAVLLPGGTAAQPELERLLRERIAPELDAIGTDLSSLPWFCGEGQPLRLQPLVADALDLLHWLTSPLSASRCEQLLLSPFFAYGVNSLDRARFDLPEWLSNHRLRPALTLNDFLENARGPASDAFSELRFLRDNAAELRLTHAVDTYPAWSERIRKLLAIAGWPAHGELSPGEFLVLEAWEGLLDQLASLQLDATRVSFSEALAALARQAERTGTPVPVRDARIQILTPEQAVALTFDVTLILDATDRSLPAPQTRHPLLPDALQLGLGFGDAARALAGATDQLRSLLHRSRELILLAPRLTGDVETGLSPLAHALGMRVVDPGTLLQARVSSVPLPLEDVVAEPPLPALPRPDVSGGADVLRLQAACGFQAFTTYRLGVRDRRAVALGLDGRQSGTLLHAALEHFWAETKSSSALEALPAKDLQQRIAQAVAAAFDRVRVLSHAEGSWERRYIAVVRRRFERLLASWLQLERTRAPFTVVAQEHGDTLDLGVLRLTMRTDRIDELEDGGVVLVDYKSASRLSVSHWLGERPEAPQLPAYALLREPDSLHGIAFAQVRPGTGSKWHALTGGADLFRKKKGRVVDLPAQIDAWRVELTRLAQSFASGDAAVAPHRYPGTCEYCALRPFCRLDPATLLEQDSDEEGENSTPELTHG